MCWRDGSAALSAGCPCRGLGFSCQHPHGGCNSSSRGPDTLFWAQETLYVHGAFKNPNICTCMFLLNGKTDAI